MSRSDHWPNTITSTAEAVLQSYKRHSGCGLTKLHAINWRYSDAYLAIAGLLGFTTMDICVNGQVFVALAQLS